jgi:outer membrane protein assembly factor BamB
VARVPFAWARRGVLAASLLAVAFVPYPVAGNAPAPPAGRCAGACQAGGPAGKVLWATKLPGEWTTSTGLAGTVPVSGQAYAAVGNGVAAVGVGLSVRAFNSRTGTPLWSAELSGFPAGAAIVSVRAWPGVVTAGVGYGPGARSRTEVVISSSSGRQVRRYAAGPFGGAVAASQRTTVVVGATAVTGYDSLTGAVRWRRATGAAAQAWQADPPYLYVTVAAGGYLGSGPVTALRRIDMGTGAEAIVRPAAHSFPGTLGGAVQGVVLFSAASGVTAYDGLTGRRLWSLSGVVPEGTDPAKGRFYLTQGTTLIGVDPLTGRIMARASGSAVAGSAGMYAVRNGVALGLDQGPNGEAWGYDVGAQRVTWTATGLPWPHYFVDLGGIGGSAEPDGATVIVAACARLAPRTPGPSGSAGPGGSPGASRSPGASGSPGPGRSPGPGSAPGAGGSPGASTSPGPSGSPATSGSASASPPPSPSNTAQGCQDPELVAISR